MKRITASVVGLGYWGPNLARNFHASEDYRLVALCDTNPARLAKAGENYPWAKRYSSLTLLLEEEQPDLVAIASPVDSHYVLAKAALEAGAHVLCEKPLARTVAHRNYVLSSGCDVPAGAPLANLDAFYAAVEGQ